MELWRSNQNDMMKECSTPSSPIIICIIGMAGAGKDYFTNKLIKYFPQLHKVVSATSRPMRPGEKEGKDYFFKTEQEFQELIVNEQLIEYREFRGWFYGTPISSVNLDKVNITICSPDGFFNIKKFFDDYQDISKVTVLPLVLLAPEEIRKERYYGRLNNLRPLDDWDRRNHADAIDHNLIANYINSKSGPYCWHHNVKPIESKEDLQWFVDWLNGVGQDIVIS